MIRNSLVIGSTGLVGSAIMRALGDASFAASIDWSRPDIDEGLRTSLRSFRRARNPEGSPFTIYWAAGRSVISSPVETIDAELATFRSALRCIAEAAPSSTALVLISSAGGLHTGTRGEPITESTPPRPISAYGRMKLAQESLLRRAVATGGFRGLILRAPTVYGPGQDLTKPQGLVSALVRSAWTSSPATVYVPRETRRHYLWADDLGYIAGQAITHASIERGSTLTRIVTTERSRTVDEVVATVARVVGRRPIVCFMATNHAPGHGLDLTFQSEFAPVWRTSDRVRLVEGVRRLVDGRRF